MSDRPTPDTPVPDRPTRLNRRELALAGLGGVLLSGCAPAALRQLGQPSIDRFGLGVASGCPQPSSLVLWTRLTGPDLPAAVDVRWEMAEDEHFRRIVARGSETVWETWAHSVHAESVDLAPGRPYFYRFHALGQTSPVGRTRTTPAPGVAASLDFAIASCQRWDHGHYAAWRHLADENLDLVIFLGDYIYESAPVAGRIRTHVGSGPARTLDEYRARYAQYRSDPALQRAHACAPWLVTWDDHEVENDYAGAVPGRPDPGFAERRAAATQAWWEHQPVPKAMRPVGSRIRIYGRTDWGTLARFHLLDGRQYRSVQPCRSPERGGGRMIRASACSDLNDPQRSMLGAEQEAWLADGWSTRQPWNFLAQQTLMSPWSATDPTSPEGRQIWTDGWDGYPAARQRLLQGLKERRIDSCVVLGGDIHASVVADLKLDFDRPDAPTLATEFCGTSISSHGRPQAAVDASRPFNPHIHYARSDQRGYLRFRADPQQLSVEVRSVHNALDPNSNISTSARFTVESGRPGAHRSDL